MFYGEVVVHHRIQLCDESEYGDVHGIAESADGEKYIRISYIADNWLKL